MNGRGFLSLILGLAFAALAWLVIAALRVDEGDDHVHDATSNVGYPRTVAIGDGVEFMVSRRPMRVIPTSSRCVDLVAELIDASRVAAVPEQAFEYATLGELEEEFRELPRFDSYLAEPVLEFLPDLVIADAWQSADTHAQLRKAGVDVLVLPEMANLDDAMRDLQLLGEVLAAEGRARAAIDDVKKRRDALIARAATRPHLTAMSYSNFGSQGFSAGSGTTLDEMMLLCGLRNRMTIGGRVGHGEVTFEDLLLFDPDLLIVSQPLHVPAGHTGDRGGASERLLLTEPSLRNLRAVKERRIVTLPSGLYASASHQILRGAEYLAQQVDQLLARLAKEAEGG